MATIKEIGALMKGELAPLTQSIQSLEQKQSVLGGEVQELTRRVATLGGATPDCGTASPRRAGQRRGSGDEGAGEADAPNPHRGRLPP